MEEWQRLVIKTHLPALVDLTSCNMELLTRLFSRDILSQEEINDIDVIQNPKRKAYKLYELIVTRKNAYQLFLFACKEAKQTGVVSILEDGESNHKLLKDGGCTVNHPSLVTKKLVPEVFMDKPPLPKTSSTKTKGSTASSNFDPKTSGHQQKNLSDKIPTQGTSDTESSNIREAFQFFQNLSRNQQDIASPLEKCQVRKSNTKIVADANANTNSDTLSGLKEKQKVGLKTDASNKHHGHLSQVYSNASVIKINTTDTEGRTSLHRALANGASLDVIKNLIDQGADYKIKDNSKEGVLHFAVRGGSKAVIRFLMSLKVNINEVDEFVETPLHKVRSTKYREYLKVTTLLLNNGANLLVKDNNGDTVAHLLSVTENISTAEFQIWVEGMINSGHGQIFAIRGQFGRTPLQNAIRERDLNLATLKLTLESSKVDIDQPDDDNFTLLHLALESGRSLETIKNLITLGANIKFKTKLKSGVLHLAVIGGNKSVIQYLISQGIDVNEKNIYGNTPLHFVRITWPKRYVELTMLLMENGADLYSKSKDGCILAHLMAIEEVSCDDFKIWATAMIENGHAHLFTIRGGQFGRTPLYLAMQRLDLDLETIKLILKSAKLGINQPDNEDNSIVHLALSFGRNLETIKGLVELGADMKRKGKDGRSVLHSAVMGSNKEAFLYLKSLGADVNAKDKYGQNPIHYVALTRSKDYLGMTKFLLENGATLNAKDSNGETLDHFMSSYKGITVAEYGMWKEGMVQLGYAAFLKPNLK